MYTDALIDGLIAAAPPLVGWTAAVILAAVLLQRRGARAERFLLIGASVKLFKALIDIPAYALSIWLTADRGLDVFTTANVARIYNLTRECIGLAGIILLAYAFWIKFVSTKQ